MTASCCRDPPARCRRKAGSSQSTSTPATTRTAQASSLGAFTITLLAAEGSSIQLKADPYGKFLPSFAGQDSDWSRFGALPGTIVRVPVTSVEGSGTAFAGMGRTRVAGSYYVASGTINGLTFQAGETVAVDFTVTLESPTLEATSHLTVDATLHLARISTAEGAEFAMQNAFGSTFLTPTGLPIERAPACGGNASALARAFAELPVPADGRSTTAATLSFTVPSHLIAGYYQPYLTFYFQGIPQTSEADPVLDIAGPHNDWLSINLPLIRVGEPAPPRLFALLFADVWSHGTRGVRAVEDRELYGMAPHIATQTDFVVIPPGRYRLEPHIPTMGISDRGFPLPEPRIPLDLPSGSFTVHLTRPEGSTSSAGPVPFAQVRSIAPARDSGESFDLGSRHPGDVYQLSTMDPRFEMTLDQYGRHRVAIEGSVDDLTGTSWTIRGTYEVVVAEPLLLDTAMLPGTPLQTGDPLSFALTTIPPLPAAVEARFRFAPASDAAKTREIRVNGTANRFGFFRPVGILPVIDEPGEYRLDISATYTDPLGVLWAGSRTWGSVVAPTNSPVVAHGRRGFIIQETTRQAWYFKSQLGPLQPASHATFPFHSGDVAWLADNAMLVALTLQDTTGEIEALISSRCQPPDDVEPGETPLFSSRADGLDIHFDPMGVDYWSYGYASVQRPLIRVREVIGDGRVGHGFGYWQFGEQYGAQPGVPDGDLTNDFKFMFGGVVARGNALSEPRYGIYGSVFVKLERDDESTGGTRVFPPFQGNGGGPSGGPILMLDGKEIDIFFHPTALRSGTILETGSRAAISGYVAPPLPAHVEVALTSPSGKRYLVSGKANDVGYFSDPSGGPEVDETGAWRTKISVSFDGTTSAGQVTAPYPSGDVLGSRGGEFFIYVVNPLDPPLDVRAGASGEPGRVELEAIAPEALQDVELHATTMMPGFILEERVSSTQTYTWNPRPFTQRFPNLDGPRDDLAYPDLITISLLLSGVDPGGERKHFARQICLLDNTVWMPAQDPRPSFPRRRGVRRQ